MATAGTAAEGLDDASLARRVASGDAGALHALMRRHNQSLYRAARSILRDDAEAEDVVQEAYLQACASIAGYRGESKLSTWLTRIVVNEALGRARRQRRRASIVRIDGATSERDVAAAALVASDTADQPEEIAARAEVRRLVERRIDALPEAFRSVFVLRALEELSVEETAQCLGLPEATVRTRFFRARGLLREALAREIDLHIETAFSFDGERCDRIVARVLARFESDRHRGD